MVFEGESCIVHTYKACVDRRKGRLVTYLSILRFKYSNGRRKTGKSQGSFQTCPATSSTARWVSHLRTPPAPCGTHRSCAATHTYSARSLPVTHSSFFQLLVTPAQFFGLQSSTINTNTKLHENMTTIQAESLVPAAMLQQLAPAASGSWVVLQQAADRVTLAFVTNDGQNSYTYDIYTCSTEDEVVNVCGDAVYNYNPSSLHSQALYALLLLTT